MGSKEHDKMSFEQFEAFKLDAIDAIRRMHYENEPHIVVALSSNHKEAQMFSLGCEWFMMQTGVELIKKATGASNAEIVNLTPQN